MVRSDESDPGIHKPVTTFPPSEEVALKKELLQSRYSGPFDTCRGVYTHDFIPDKLTVSLTVQGYHRPGDDLAPAGDVQTPDFLAVDTIIDNSEANGHFCLINKVYRTKIETNK
jgi:hypothetical protein